jgi:hypothetical protein
MAIQYIDRNGQRAQLKDRIALVQAVWDGDVDGDTRVYVPAKNAFLPLGEVFDMQRLREGDMRRRAAAPAAAAAWRARVRKWWVPALLVGSVVVIVGTLVVAGRKGYDDYQRRQQQAQQQARQQMASDLGRVKEQVQRNLAQGDAMGASAPRVVQPAAPADTIQSRDARLIAEQVARIQALTAAHGEKVARLSGEGFMTPASLATPAGIARNRARLAELTQAVDDYYAGVQQAQRDYVRQAEQLPGHQPGELAAQLQQSLDFHERARVANRRKLQVMGLINDFAEATKPELSKQQKLLFRSELALEQWRKLGKDLSDAEAELGKLQAERGQQGQKALQELQQKIDALGAPRS